MLRGRLFFGIIVDVVWILWVIAPRIGGTAVKKKLGHLLHPGMGLYFLVMAIFCLSTAFAGHTSLAAFEAVVTAVAFTFYMTRKQYRHRQLQKTSYSQALHPKFRFQPHLKGKMSKE